jgi:hypothetical protein
VGIAHLDKNPFAENLITFSNIIDVLVFKTFSNLILFNLLNAPMTFLSMASKPQGLWVALEVLKDEITD